MDNYKDLKAVHDDALAELCSLHFTTGKTNKSICDLLNKIGIRNCEGKKKLWNTQGIQKLRAISENRKQKVENLLKIR